MSGYTEENFNRLLERLHKRERVISELWSLIEEYKAGVAILEKHRDFWKALYHRTEAEFDQYCKSIRGVK